MNIEKIVETLNEAYRLDPMAIRSLISFQVPINKELAEHETIQAIPFEDGYATSFVGVLNGLISEASDPDRLIASCWSEEENPYGHREFLGFAVVKPQYMDEL